MTNQRKKWDFEQWVIVSFITILGLIAVGCLGIGIVEAVNLSPCCCKCECEE